MKKLLIFCLICFSIIAKAETLQIESASLIKQQIAQQMESSVACWNKGDLTCFMQSYENSDRTLFISGTKFIFGWQNSFDHYMLKYGKNKSDMGNLDIIVKNIEVLDSNYAYLYGNYFLVKDGKEYSGVTSLLFILDSKSQSWKIILDHSS